VERLGEGRALVRADLVACGTDEVASQVRRLGVSTNRILVTPTGVDLDLFAMSPDERDDCRRRSREELRVSDRFVVGWVGSFRRFHALEQAVEATAFIGDATLLLIGDGPERRGIERLAAERGVDARFTGTVPYAELPAYLAAMDVALVLARPDQPFHYSPLKLGEYLAAGLPVIAPDALRKDDRVSDGDDVILVAPGDLEALTDALRQLSDHETAREKLRAAARATAERRWSWDHQIRRILEHLYGSHTFAP
jgi:glycosyltransferase involved in cell wall biosynthesis